MTKLQLFQTHTASFSSYLVCPSESFQMGSVTTGLIAHSRIAKARANSRALLHIWTALFQLFLCKTKIGDLKSISRLNQNALRFQCEEPQTNPSRLVSADCTCATPSWGAWTEPGRWFLAGWWWDAAWKRWDSLSRKWSRSTWTRTPWSGWTCGRGAASCRGPPGAGACWVPAGWCCTGCCRPCISLLDPVWTSCSNSLWVLFLGGWGASCHSRRGRGTTETTGSKHSKGSCCSPCVAQRSQNQNLACRNSKHVLPF